MPHFCTRPSPVCALPRTCAVVIAACLVLLAADTAQRQGVASAWGLAVAVLMVLALNLVIRIVQLLSCRIEIDEARIRVSAGLVVREVCSLELFRIQNVWSVTRWWQAPFDVGDIVIETSDARHPVWRLTGMRDPQALRDALNVAALELRRTRGVSEVNFGVV